MSEWQHFRQHYFWHTPIGIQSPMLMAGQRSVGYVAPMGTFSPETVKILSAAYAPAESSPGGRTRMWRPADTTAPQFTAQEPLPITPEALRDLIVACLKLSGDYREASEVFETPPKRSRRAARRKLKKGKRR